MSETDVQTEAATATADLPDTGADALIADDFGSGIPAIKLVELLEGAGYVVVEGGDPLELTAKLINEAADAASLHSRIDELVAAKAQLEADLAAARSAKPAPATRHKAATSGKARSIGASGKVKPASEPDEPTASHRAISEGGVFELVASDGKKEITAFHPVEIESTAFKPWGKTLLVGEPIDLLGGEGIETIDGFGLIHEGKQIDYCKLVEPLVINPHETHRVANALFFG